MVESMTSSPVHLTYRTRLSSRRNALLARKSDATAGTISRAFDRGEPSPFVAPPSITLNEPCIAGCRTERNTPPIANAFPSAVTQHSERKCCVACGTVFPITILDSKSCTAPLIPGVPRIHGVSTSQRRAAANRPVPSLPHVNACQNRDRLFRRCAARRESYD